MPARDVKVRPEEAASDFIRDAIREDLRTGRCDGVMTRFPPEPNGYLHIGHAKPICLNFWIAEEFGGVCNLRFDDTNPLKEEEEYVDAIMKDIRWLGFDWGGHLYFASDYFEQLHAFAATLIEAGKAFVCDLGPEEVRDYRGTLTRPGRESPFRSRSVEENLDLFARMRAGEVSGRVAYAPGQDRHGIAQHEHAGSGDVPNYPRLSPSYGGSVAHLSHVRLRSRTVGFHRGCDAFTLFGRV